MNRRFKIIAAGFAVGILSGLLGIGGGVFLVPIMVTYFAVSQHTAHGTSLAAVIPTAIASAAIYGFHGNVDMGLTIKLVLGSMVGAALGARLATRLPAARLKQLFGLLLVVVGIRMVIA